jgi:hypothetical protein
MSANTPVPSRYSNMLRILKKHRKQMRITEDYLFESGLLDEMEDRIIEETGSTPIHLDIDSVMDAPNDATDPDAQLREEVQALREEATDRQAFIAAAQSVVTGQQNAEVVNTMRRDLERARMSLEDGRV